MIYSLPIDVLTCWYENKSSVLTGFYWISQNKHFLFHSMVVVFYLPFYHLMAHSLNFLSIDVGLSDDRKSEIENSTRIYLYFKIV